MEEENLKKLQKIECDILKDVTDFCNKRNINFSLFCGTAIGAIRHGGFIPWDDDIDICMTRKNYELFLDEWIKEKNPKYFLQDTRGNNDSRINHSKIMRVGTKYCSKEELSKEGCHGIFLDVFPLDLIPTNKIKNIIYKFVASVRLVYTRNYPFEKGSKLLCLISKVMLKLPNNIKKYIKLKCENYILKYNEKTKNVKWICNADPDDLKLEYDYKIMQDYISINFENITTKIVKDYDYALTQMYGNYMELPPENERICSHLGEIIDFGDTL